MTINSERLNSLYNARLFLLSLLDPKLSPRVPLEIRRRARNCLKHFPQQYEIKQIAKKLPKLFGKWPENK